MINLKKFYNDLICLNVPLDKPMSEMDSESMANLIGAAMNQGIYPCMDAREGKDVVRYWAEVLQWHETVCVCRCHKGLDCETANGYRNLIKNAGEKMNERIPVEESVGILSYRALDNSIENHKEKGGPVSVELGAQTSVPCPSQQLFPVGV